MTTATLAASGARRRFNAYAKLANLYFYDYYLCVLVVWSLLAATMRFEGETLITLLLVNAGWGGVVAATVTFDDVTGFRDGSDDRNYAPEQAALRNRENKPLIAGHLKVGQAVRFGWAATVFGAAMWVLAIAVAPHRPAWAAVLTAVVLFISVQYSYGLKFSYRFGQELVLLLSPGLMVLVPYGLLTGKVTGLILLEAYLFGLWSLLVSVYSNLNDIEGDRAAGRRNLATTCSPRAYRIVVAAISATEIAAVLIGLSAGVASWWFLAFVTPVLLVRVRQLRTGLIAGDFLTARKLGITGHRLGVVVITIANLALAH